MMTPLSSEVIRALKGRTLVTAESLTGGGIGAELTSVPGASAVYKGGIISYVNQVKQNILGVPAEVLDTFGAVSRPTAQAMALGARKLLKADFALSVTGLAGPTGDEFGHEVGTVFVGFSCEAETFAQEYHFAGARQDVRNQTIEAALMLLLEQLNEK